MSTHNKSFHGEIRKKIFICYFLQSLVMAIYHNEQTMLITISAVSSCLQVFMHQNVESVRLFLCYLANFLVTQLVEGIKSMKNS